MLSSAKVATYAYEQDLVGLAPSERHACETLKLVSGRYQSKGSVQVKRAIQLRNIVTSLGPAYIKVGHLSCSTDVVCSVCDHLMRPPDADCLHA